LTFSLKWRLTKIFLNCHDNPNKELDHSRKVSHYPHMEKFSAILKGQGEKIVSEDSKCIRTSKESRVDLQYPLWWR
jgi:hypothetical protein